MATERTQKQKDHSRAFGLRSHLTRGNEIAAEDKTWFDAYVAEHPRMALASARPVETPPAPGGEALAPSGESPPPADPPLPQEQPITPPPPTPPTPPRTAIPKPPRVPPPPRFDPAPQRAAKNASPAAGAAGCWQEKYAPKNDAGAHVDPREYLCLQVASVWGGFLSAGADLLSAIGKQPAVKPEEIMPSIVLACDRLLPSELDFSPEKMAVAATGILAAQCAINYKAIGGELKRRKEAAAHEGELSKMKRRTAEAEAKFQAEEATRRAATVAADKVRRDQEAEEREREEAEAREAEERERVDLATGTTDRVVPDFDPESDPL